VIKSFKGFQTKNLNPHNIMKANHVRNCTRLRIICYAIVRSAPAERSKGTGRESEEEVRKSEWERPGEAGPSRRRGPTPTGDAFTYLTCNNLEKVLTIARGSSRFERKARRHRDETEGSGGWEGTFNERTVWNLKSWHRGHVQGWMLAKKLFMESISRNYLSTKFIFPFSILRGTL